jgi:hypothetical protein
LDVKLETPAPAPQAAPAAPAAPATPAAPNAVVDPLDQTGKQ